VRQLVHCLESGQNIFSTGLVLQELLQGFSGPKARAQIVDRFSALPLLLPDRSDHIDARRVAQQVPAAPASKSNDRRAPRPACIRHNLLMLTTIMILKGSARTPSQGLAAVSGKSKPKPSTNRRSTAPATASGSCLCGAIEIEIDFPAFWPGTITASRRGSPTARPTRRISAAGEDMVASHKGMKKSTTRFDDNPPKRREAFCARCGSPILYEKDHSPHMVHIPRALFAGRTGREPRYHLNFAERQDWEWAGEKLVPLMGFPGVVWERPKRRNA